MEPIRCFFIEPTGRKFFKRGSSTMIRHEYPDGGCPNNDNAYHVAYTETVLEENMATLVPPSICSCGYEFKEGEIGNCGQGSQEYRRTDTNELLPLGEQFPVGAMWHATWREGDWLPPYGEDSKDGKPLPWWRGPDEKVLCVMCPGGEWCIDSRCSNCGMPNDNKHRCWVRHGEPPNITVDKSGLTCNAGAGSIWIRMPHGWHGFLKNGYLTEQG